MLLFWIGIILIVIIAVSMSLSIFLSQRHQQQESSNPGMLGLSYEDISFITIDKLTLHGWWIPAPGSVHTIVFLHGFHGSMDPDLKYAPSIHNAGYNILMFDFRAHGRSDGTTITLGALEVQDVNAAVEYALKRGSEKIGLLGFSMGGRTALLAAPESNLVIRAIVSDGGPLNLTVAILHRIKEKGFPWGLRHLLCGSLLLGLSVRTGKNLFRINPVCNSTNSSKIPILLIHAEFDHYTNSVDLQRMVRGTCKNVTLEVIPGVGHRETDTIGVDNYLSKIIAFFNYNLKPMEEL